MAVFPYDVTRYYTLRVENDGPGIRAFIDGEMRRVVMFPDDGHPDLACNVADLTGNVRDEVILWDTGQVWIYTQDQPFTGKRIYSPVRNPDYNESNYRTTVSMPRWKDQQ